MQKKPCEENLMTKNKLDIVIGTKREALWMRVRDLALERIKTAQEDLEVQEEVVKRAKEIIKEENAINRNTKG